MTEDIQSAAASASEPALALRAKPQERLDASRFDQAQEMITMLHQYRNDLLYPVAPDSVQRRLAAIEALLAKAGGSA